VAPEGGSKNGEAMPGRQNVTNYGATTSGAVAEQNAPRNQEEFDQRLEEKAAAPGALEKAAEEASSQGVEPSIGEDVRGPEMNRAYGTGNGRYRDTQTGQYTKSPFSSEQLEETQQKRFTNEFGVTLLQGDLVDLKGAVALTPQLGLLGGDVTLGATLEGGVKVGGEVELNKEGLNVSGSASAKAALVYARGEFENPELGTASFNVGSTAQARAEAKLQLETGGPLGVKGTVGGSASAEAVALKFSGRYESPDVEVPLTFGILQAHVVASGDINVGGIGGSVEGGVGTLETKPGVSAYVGAGLTPLVGGRGKVNVELSVNTERALEVYNDVARSAAEVYNNTIKVVNSIQEYWRSKYQEYTR
jgi:hypothetical protein